MDRDLGRKVMKTDAEWRAELTPEQYAVLRQRATEPPFTGEHLDHGGPGRYLCGACGAPIFDAETKFESGSGWPSFHGPLADESVELHDDRSHGMVRTEVVCAACGSHLGHVFDDGPPPTGMRYCINSVALDFAPHGAAATGGNG